MQKPSELQIDYETVNTPVDVEPLAEMFAQAAIDLELEELELAGMVGARIGFGQGNTEKAANGVLYLLGLRPNRLGALPDRITGGRATQLAYALRLIEDDLENDPRLLRAHAM